ncbi:zinc-dependent alcohol dehydrogenase family protein [Rhodococcus qingshengii]|uniref:zinc-dependent alcohol dehydrogenase family protein n=1 Tax=Rhodococcus qingshengii TaxID=334542 RepID=UPI0010A6A55D|nr:NAD(P)-dependent alcohol dehydrogenase [Rhodococcus qingshengii]THJ67639.1 NAD(P)-dependent alcohol dehydrogenase [Rhodococcus qingshengii]
MRTWHLTPGTTGTDALTFGESEVPEPGPGEVRVAVRAASVNYRDQIIVNGGFGLTIAEPTVPLSDASGVIDAVGPGVDRWRVGDEVVSVYVKGWIDGPPPAAMGFGLGSPGEDGVLAEYIVLAADRVATKPASLSFVEAATLTCAGMTAWSALTADHPVQPGQRVLTMGTGGVGLFALQLALAMGANVISLTSGEDKAARLRELGASQVLNYRTTPDWGLVVAASTGGVDKIVNSSGGDAMTQSIMAVGGLGEIAVMGLFSAGDEALPLPVLMSKGASIRGSTVGSSTDLARFGAYIDEHAIKPIIGQVFPFAEAKAAYEAQARPGVFGKIVIEVAQ